MLEGPLAALDAIDAATGERSVNAVGYCLGGTLLASTLAYLAAHGDDRIASATYFVTLVDFAEVGDMAVFIDEDQIASLEKRMQERGYLEAHDMATSFNMLRANDLIWSFVVSNYLLGREQTPFDLLFWNSDATRMPAAMHSFYLRNMYQRNLLAKPGGISLAGTPIDLARIKAPTFILSSREDHIAPWKSTYAATRLYSGSVKFVLAASGHMAGVISPPGSKYGHWTNDDLPSTADEWLDGAKSHQGSWWPHVGRVGDAIRSRPRSSTFAWRRQAGGDRGRAWRLRPCTIRRLTVDYAGEAWGLAPISRLARAAWDRSQG